MDSQNVWPSQMISDKRKDSTWAKNCIKFFEHDSVINSSEIRHSVAHNKINYDLYSGIINMKDVLSIVNPNKKKGANFLTRETKLQHFPLMNNKIQLLIGEEIAARLDFSAVITNPNAVSEIEKTRQKLLMQSWEQLLQDSSLSDEDYQQKLTEISDHFIYDWQDEREVAVNCILKHYWEELNMPLMFHDGFLDVCICNEEIYQCSIVGGDPTVRRLDPLKVHVYGLGSDNKIENAEAIVIEDYWQISRVIDEYSNCGEGRSLTEKDIKTLEKAMFKNDTVTKDRIDTQLAADAFGTDFEIITSDNYDFNDSITANELPYDLNGNIRVLQVYWKSLRKILRVKRYDSATGDTNYKFMPSSYICDKSKGEEGKVMWVPQAWKGVMIGAGEKAIFVDVGPCPIQYNRMSDPCKCHFGIVGTIYNYNGNKPYSLVDMMKPYNYAYDIQDYNISKKCNRDAGKLMVLNATMKPAGWSDEKWMENIYRWGAVFVDPFNEGAKGKPAGMFNIAPTMDVDLSASIEAGIRRLDQIESAMGRIVGITPQREGMVSNRETVGGIERATIQSTHTSRWYTAKHQDTQKRVLEAFVETAKIAWRSDDKKPAMKRKFSYISGDSSKIIVTIDGDTFAECDYGITLKVNYDMQAIEQQIQQVALAAAQNGKLGLSSYMKIVQPIPLADKIKIIENAEKHYEETAKQVQQQQLQAEQQVKQEELQQKQAELNLKDLINRRDNETKLAIAQMQREQQVTPEDPNNDLNREKLMKDIEKTNAEINLERDRFNFEKSESAKKLKLEEKKLAQQRQKSNTK